MSSSQYDEYGFRITPKKETPVSTTENPDTTDKKKTIYTAIGIMIVVGSIIGCFLAGFISWNCYANNLKNVRIVKTILAVLFFYLYLPYFFLLRVVLQQPCF